jgi:hypothetical protein
LPADGARGAIRGMSATARGLLAEPVTLGTPSAESLPAASGRITVVVGRAGGQAGGMARPSFMPRAEASADPPRVW